MAESNNQQKANIVLGVSRELKNRLVWAAKQKGMSLYDYLMEGKDPGEAAFARARAKEGK